MSTWASLGHVNELYKCCRRCLSTPTHPSEIERTLDHFERKHDDDDDDDDDY